MDSLPMHELRELLRWPIIGLKDQGTHTILPEICEKLGLPPPNSEGSKRERMESSFNALRDDDLLQVADNFLKYFPPDSALRNNIEEMIWMHGNHPEVPKRYRRELANRLEGEYLFLNSRHFETLLDRLWILDDGTLDIFLLGEPAGLRAEIQQHVIRNPDDWSVDYLFERLGAYDCSDRRFLLFIEGLVSSDVRPDINEQERFANLVNDTLKSCGIELQITGTEGGYPLYSAIQIDKGVHASPKNLIFASQVKPDIRFRDAINNDIEIVTNAEKVLVFDRPIGTEGLCWTDLQNWWAVSQGMPDDETAKRTLYKRLLESLPPNSPPQRLLFETYFKRFRGAIPGLPALLPEVWLHWDPKTVRERGVDALLRFRMDFLMLFPRNIRVIIEVDGKHHYSDELGRANAPAYAAMVKADRDLRLVGYDVYRFGGEELTSQSGPTAIIGFFERLLQRYRINAPAGISRS
jgi:hypothetical protein